MSAWPLPCAQRERAATAATTSSADWALPSFERRPHSRETRTSRPRRSAPTTSRQFARTTPGADGNTTFSHVDFLRKSTRMPSPSRHADGSERRRLKREPQTPSFAQPTGRLRSGRGVGRAALTAQARAQSDLEEVIKGTDHLRDIRRQYEQLASTMRRAHTQSSRDGMWPSTQHPLQTHVMTTFDAAEWVSTDKRWHDRMDQNREDMRKKLQQARDHFAKELHNDQITTEREKLRRNRKMAGSLATHRQAWADFEATDWGSSGPIRLVRRSYSASQLRLVV